MRSLIVALAVAPLFSLGCSSTPAVIDPSLSISSPSSNAAVTVDSSKKLAVNFNTNYHLKLPGTCDGEADCGSVYMLIDNSGCNASGQAYNVITDSSPVEVDFSLCSTVVGQHTITAELHSDSGSIVDSTITKDPVTSNVTVTVQPS